jgi:hypothetical protein
MVRLLLLMLCLPTASGLWAQARPARPDTPLRRPVIFSYSHPWGSDKNPNEGWTDPWFMDFTRVRLSTANLVDNADPKAYAAWRTPDRRILARVSTWAAPWQDDKANDLIKAWDAALSQDGIDGLAMDEFIGKDVTPELTEVWVTALKEVRRRHPDKVLAFWTDSGLGRLSMFGKAHQRLLEALRDYADFAMPEIYYQEKSAPDFRTNPAPFAVFREKVDEWEAQAPGITPKILMGLGTVQNADWGYDNLPEVDYGEFLARQVEVCATDPVLRRMAGLALYAPGYLRPDTLTRVNDAIIKYYGLQPVQEGRKTFMPDHPRLYFSHAELTHLRATRDEGERALIWRNLARSADWCLTQKPRTEWIAPVAPDPIYENLYDRFYAMMHDMAVMEHLAFAYSYSGDARYAKAGCEWAMACCRVWRHEADGEVDGGKAYAVTRLLKGLAVSYDLLYDQLTEAERQELREALTSIGQLYYEHYFTTPNIAGEAFHTHHAIVEWASFGVTALALLGEYPPATDWLAATVRKFEQHLLPLGLAEDGAQVEGATFWASTMQYRLMFMSALRHVTGQDLFQPFAAQMDGRLALAATAAPRLPGWDEDHQTVIFEPSYGQLNYYSPVLVALAREYRNPLCQHLALWDHTLGAVQESRYITPHGEWMLFDWGGYAYAWFDPTVPAAAPADAPRVFAFPSVGEAYLRSGYDPGGIVAGCKNGQSIIHAGGRAVLVDVTGWPQADGSGLQVHDDGRHAALRWTGATGGGFRLQSLRLRRPDLLTLVRRTIQESMWWCSPGAVRDGNCLRWPDGTTVTVKKGTLTKVDPEGYHDQKIVGMGLLKCVDPMPMTYPQVTASPENGELVIEVRTPQ